MLLENLGYIFDAVPCFQFASVDIVYKESITKHLSIKKNKELLGNVILDETLSHNSMHFKTLKRGNFYINLKENEHIYIYIKIKTIYFYTIELLRRNCKGSI